MESSGSKEHDATAVPASPTKSTSSTHTNTDDESIITTSTESDEAWTLVTDKTKQLIRLAEEALDKSMKKTLEDDEAEDDDETEDDDDEADNQLPDQSNTTLHEHHSTADEELSDGISIISECESAGRLSPHPNLAEQLNSFTLGENYDHNSPLPRAKLNLPIIQSAETIEHIEDVVDRGSLTQRRRRRSSPKKIEPAKVETKALKRVDVLAQINEMPPIVRHGLSGMFYVTVAIVAIAIMGKLRMLVWDPIAAHNNAQHLEQKVNDLELQNNLIMAEIDLLNKQVKHLSNVNDGKAGKNYGNGNAYPQQQQPNEKRKTFKAWSGNGDNLEPVDINKGDLKRPYKCPNGQFVEVAGMCVQNTFGKEPEKVVKYVDPVSNVINKVLDKSETLRNFAKVAEEVNAFVENPFEAVMSAVTGEKPAGNSQAKAPEQPIPPPPPPLSSPTPPPLSAQERREQWQQKRGEVRYQKDFKKEKFEKSYDRINSKERAYKESKPPQYRQNSGESSKERFNDGGKQRKDSKERFDGQQRKDSKERFAKTKDRSKEDDSRERFQSNERKEGGKREAKPRYPNNNSKERYDARNVKKNHSGERNKDGHWQEDLMQQRENARRQRHEHERNDKNWYIERGDSREQMRYQ